MKIYIATSNIEGKEGLLYAGEDKAKACEACEGFMSERGEIGARAYLYERETLFTEPLERWTRESPLDGWTERDGYLFKI